jgi:hypothetical protein
MGDPFMTPAMGKLVKRGRVFISSFLFSLKAVFVFSSSRFSVIAQFGSSSLAVLRFQ